MDIDFVVMWVDGNDPKWQEEKNKYQQESDVDASDGRYRDYGFFKYWFRGIEKFAPWVRYVHFVTWGHVPEWLDTSNPKLRIVRHEDIMPSEILPTFNSSVIELYLHKIPELSEHFVFFNDDVFLLKEISPKVFFQKEKPVDMLAFQPVIANVDNPVMSNIYMNNTLLLAKHFNKRKNVRENLSNYYHIGYPPLYFFYNILELGFPNYTGFYTVHGPAAFLKSTYETVWKEEGDALMEASKNRFRSRNDVTQYLLREWQKLSGDFTPRNVHRNFKYYELGRCDDKLIRTIQKQKKKTICINEGKMNASEKTLQDIENAFQTILPEKSSFEQ